MARRKPTETPKPEPVVLSLLRCEERVERVEITPDQKAERLSAAAAVFADAATLDMQLVAAKEEVKSLKQRAAAKHAEGERIVAEAQSGTTAAPYPVIVERHPSRPLEMNVWRVPDGMAPSDVLVLAEEGDARIAAREAQGCTLVETRAMNPDEVAVAEEEDRKRREPELPLDQEQQASATPDAGPSASEEEASTEGEGEQEESEPTRAASPQPLCPYVEERHETDPRQDKICGVEGIRRARGFCSDHYASLGGKNGSASMTEMITRRTQRRMIEEEAREQAERETARSEDVTRVVNGYAAGGEDSGGEATF